MLNWKTNPAGDNYLYEVVRDLFASDPAETVLSKRFGSRLLEDDWLHVVVGSDSGLLPAFVGRHLPRGNKARYIFVELDEVLDELRARERDHHPHVEICSLGELAEVRMRLGFAQFCFRDRVRVVSAIAADEDFIGGYGALREAVTVSQTKAEQAVRLSAGSKVFLEKCLLNAPDYLHTLIEVLPFLERRDVLILAAGPSLDRHIEWVKAHRDKFVVLAVARIGGVLAAHGIVPDFYAVIDPHPIMLNVGRDALAQSAAVPLLASFHANPTIVANWQADIYFDGARLPWTSELNLPFLDTAGPTVTHFALSIAVMAVPRAIYLLGMDLCYGGNGLQSHCSQSSEAKAGPSLGQMGVQQVRTYAGELADADVHLLLSADTAAAIAEHARKKSIPICNLSDTAQVVQGIDYINPEEIDVAALPGPAPSEGSSGEEDRALSSVGDYLVRLSAEFEAVMSDLESLREDLQRRKEKIPELFDSRGLIRPKNSRKLAGIDNAVARLGRGLDAFLKKWGAGYFLVTVTGKSEEEITPADLCAYYEDYYGAYLRSILEVNDTIRLAMRKCDRRLQELSEKDLSRLVGRWEAESEPLRIGKKLLQPHLRSLEGYATLRGHLQSVFENMRAELTRADEKRCRKEVNKHNVITKAYYLYERKRQRALNELVDFVGRAGDPEFGRGLLHLVGGLSCELDGRSDEALREYESALDSGDDVLLELSLRQILFIAKTHDDYKLSLQALECLEGLSNTYLKYHAEVLLQLGNVREALDKLADYHDHFPDDIDNLVRIVEIYHLNGNDEQARTILGELLQAYPSHVGVQRLSSQVLG